MNAPTRVLGRGLGSLIAEGGQAISTQVESKPVIESSRHSSSNDFLETVSDGDQDSSSFGNELRELLLEQVIPNPHQPRKVMDPEAVSELAASIESEGLLQPIVVRPTEKGFELIAGERRWRAHQRLGRSTILARVVEATDLSSSSLSLIENLQREELNPVEEAMGYQSLISDFNLGQQEVARRIGKSRSHVANLLRLLQLDGELKRLLSDGELSVGHAKVLLGVEDCHRRLALGRQAVLEGWTVRQTEDAIASQFGQRGSSPSVKPRSSALFDDLARSATSSTGRKVKIKCTFRGKGTISLSFKDEEDLRALIARIAN